MLLLAAGRSERFGSSVPKVFHDCAGQPVVLRSAERLARVAPGAELVLAIHPRDAAHVEALRPRLFAAGVTQVVAGGASRQESMALALAAGDPAAELVVVHDAARPLFPVEAARAALARAAEVGAALLAVPVADTLKREGEGGLVRATVERAGLWLAQTPQVARRELLAAALARARREGWEATDEAGLLERHGCPVALVMGAPGNLKITTAEDLAVAAALCRSEGP
jgi:2-C-methyl-D-erythritol 4-phosphate cytidylyltransferase